MSYPPIIVRSRSGAELHTESGALLDFTAGDIFAIASHPQVRAAAHSAVERFGVAPISALERGGTTDIHRAAEQLVAEKLVAERAVLYPNRTQAIVSLLTAGINPKGGTVLIDASVSSPAMDACHLGELSAQRTDLCSFLDGPPLPLNASFLLMEGVSKFGQHVPNLLNILPKLSVPIIADESFSFGITGLLGMGNFPTPLLNNLPVARIISFELSLGLPCCAVVGTKNFIDSLSSASLQRAAESGVSHVECAALVVGFELLEAKAAKRDELGIRAAELISELSEYGVTLASELPLPIIAINLPTTKIAREFCAGMLSRGFLVDLIGCTTPLSQVCSVRLILSISHSKIQLEALAKSVIEVWKRTFKKT